MNILKAEWFKIIRKKEIYIFLLVFMGIAVLFSFLFGTNSDIMVISGLDKMGGMFFSVFVYNFISELFFVQAIIAVTVTGIWASEFNDGTMANTIVKAKNRKQIFICKSYLSIFSSLVFVLTLFTSSWLFYMIIGKNGKYYTNNFIEMPEKERLGSYCILIFLMIVFSCAIVTLLSMFESQVKALLFYLVMLVVMKILEQVDFIKNIVPSYLFGSGNVFMPDWENSMLLWNILVIMVWSGVLYATSYIIFKKKNIS